MGLKIDFIETFSRENIIAELQTLAKTLGRSTLSRRDIDLHGRVSSGLVIKKFGSLRKALQEAGLVPVRFMKGTDEELCSILVQLWTQTLEKFGRSPYRKELGTFGFPISSDTYVRRFGSWKKALLAAHKSVSSAEEDPSTTPTVPHKETTANVRKSLSVRKRFFVFKRDDYRCRICGISGVQLEVDHRVPVFSGGSDALGNLQTLCFECNRGKRNSSE